MSKLTIQAASGARRKATTLRLRVTAAAERRVRAGHPWVFANSVREQNREGLAGELAVIFDREDRLLAVGFFDPDSPIRVRVLHVGKPLTIGTEFWRTRLDTAVRRRDGLFDEHTTGYRLINGESDGWPGLVLDRYDATLVLKIYAAAWSSRLEEIIGLIRERLKPERIVLRTSRNLRGSASRTGLPPHPGPLPLGGGEGEFTAIATGDGAILFGPPVSGPVVFTENDLRFEAEVVRGQKTGFFLDQRENRRQVESLASGRVVLNAFSFSGGFSLYAARGGATSVTDLDISAQALDSARRNFALNQAVAAIAQCPRDSVQADAFEWLAGNARRKFGMIILDPPSLAKREVERAGAIRAYAKLAEAAINQLAPDGILVACSCSAHVTAEEFFAAVRGAAGSTGRKYTELQTTRHALDHAATFKEADYLKGVYLRLT